MRKPDPALALAVGGIGAWTWDVSANAVLGDSAFDELLSFDDASAFQDAINAASVGTDQIELSFQPVTTPSRWVTVRGAVTARDVNDAPAILTGVIWDITDSKAREDRLSILAREMDHRVKNSFAVIRALIGMAVRVSPQHDAFAASLKAQVKAMGAAHAVSARLARETGNPQTPVPLADVLQTTLAPWRTSGRMHETVSADFLLSPQEVASVSMLVYELAANAAKYGALSARGGALSITAERASAGHRVLTWVETCEAPPFPQTATSETDAGFGAVLVDHCAKTLDAKVARDINDAGLTLQLTLKPIAP